MEIALPLLVIRLVIGLGFAAHGAQKLFGWFGGYGIAGTGGFFETLGFKPGRFFAAAAGFSELAGGLLIAAGLGGPVGAMFVIAAMLVALVVVHLRNGFFATSNGVELPLLYLLVALFYAFGGYGPLSIDAVLGIAGVWSAGLIWGVVILGFLGGLGNIAVRRKTPAPPAPETLDPAV
ncbi:MAG: putative oxidoreductase [Candidatus Eremiobacteraeota bacterium]|jgi:putative oxidoreductase|nr:putative oxidoreductase [Candidatus Eremiobacteraeota bacterium]